MESRENVLELMDLYEEVERSQERLTNTLLLDIRGQNKQIIKLLKEINQSINLK